MSDDEHKAARTVQSASDSVFTDYWLHLHLLKVFSLYARWTLRGLFRSPETNPFLGPNPSKAFDETVLQYLSEELAISSEFHEPGPVPITPENATEIGKLVPPVPVDTISKLRALCESVLDLLEPVDNCYDRVGNVMGIPSWSVDGYRPTPTEFIENLQEKQYDPADLIRCVWRIVHTLAPRGSEPPPYPVHALNTTATISAFEGLRHWCARLADSVDSVNSEDDVPAEYCDGEDPKGKPLTAEYVGRPETYGLSSSYLTKHFGDGRELTKRLKFGRTFVYLFREIAALSSKRTARTDGND